MNVTRVSEHEVRSPADAAGPASLLYRIVTCVATLRGVDPARLPPLAEVVDPAAVEAICGPGSGVDGHLSFGFASTTVTVTGTGDVRAVRDEGRPSLND